MEKTTDPNKKICDKSSSGTTIQKLSSKTSSNPSEKTTTMEKKGFFNLIQKLVCTPNLENDESEVFKVPKFAPK